MEIVFILTHAVMIICLIGVLNVLISSRDEHVGIEKSDVISPLVTRVKTMQIDKGPIVRAATALQGLLLR